ncbi:hypothetical protein KI387_036645, partial [Taxus chinensis]
TKISTPLTEEEVMTQTLVSEPSTADVTSTRRQLQKEPKMEKNDEVPQSADPAKEVMMESTTEVTRKIKT